MYDIKYDIKWYDRDGLYVNRDEAGNRIVRIYDVQNTIYGKFYENSWIEINCVEFKKSITPYEIEYVLMYNYFDNEGFRKYKQKETIIGYYINRVEKYEEFKKYEVQMIKFGRLLAQQLGLRFLKATFTDDNKVTVREIKV